MFPNYDADAVAELMGVGFVAEGQAELVMPDGAPAAEQASADRKVMQLGLADHPDVRVIEVGPKPTTKPRPRSQAARPSPVLIERAVESGLPRFALRNVAEHLAGNEKAKVAPFEWAVVPKTTLERRGKQLSPQESERTERVARLFVHARRALGTEDEARVFMTTPHPQLEDRTPFDASRTDLGTRRVEQILNALEYGLAL